MASLLAEIRDLDVSRPALRRFGFWVGGVLLGLGGWMWLRGGPAAVWLLVAGGGLVLAGAAAPGWLQWLYRFWMGLSLVLGHVVGTVLLVLVFYGVFTPLGWLARRCGQDFLRQRPDPQATTWWITRPPARGSGTGYEKQG